METEAHVYALAISASVLLAFYPFIMVVTSICRDVLGWTAAQRAVSLALKDFFAGEQGEFIVNNIQRWMVPNLQLSSLTSILSSLTTIFLLLFTANGIFEPLEVALNRAWGVTHNRSYLKNQVVSLGLIFACGGLALISLMLTAAGAQLLPGEGWFFNFMESMFFKMAAVPVSILALFLVYWLLPNRKVDPRRVAPVAILVGLTLEFLKYLNLAVAPLLEKKFEHEYRIFRHSVTIIVLSFVASLIVLAGAHWTANHDKQDPLS